MRDKNAVKSAWQIGMRDEAITVPLAIALLMAVMTSISLVIWSVSPGVSFWREMSVNSLSASSVFVPVMLVFAYLGLRTIRKLLSEGVSADASIVRVERSCLGVFVVFSFVFEGRTYEKFGNYGYFRKVREDELVGKKLHILVKGPNPRVVIVLDPWFKGTVPDIYREVPPL